VTEMDAVVTRLTNLVALTRDREGIESRPIDRQLWKAKAEAYENALEMVTRALAADRG